MSVILNFRSRAAQVIRDQQKVIKQTKQMAGGYKETQKEASQLERSAKRLNRQLEGPQERYNRKLREASQLLKSGRINQDQMRRAVELYNRQLREAEGRGLRAFGGASVARLAAFAGGLFTIHRAAGAVVEALNRIDQARAAGAQRAISASQAFGGLVGLAGGDPEKKSRFFQATKRTFAEGGFETVEGAERLVFELASANLLGERRFGSRLQAIDDAAQLAKSAGGLREAFGVKEAGTFRQIVSKGIAAAAPVTGAEASGILAAAARAGATGGEAGLGLSDEEIIAAVAQISKVAGTERAGTQAEALFRSFTSMGFADRPGPRSLAAMMASVEGRQLLKSELQKELGREQAGRAFSLLTGPSFGEMLATVRSGQAEDVAGRTIGLALSTPEIAIPRRARAARAREQLSTERLDLIRLQVDAALARQRAMDRQTFGTGQFAEFTMVLEDMANNLARKIAGDEAFAEARGISINKRQLETLERIEQNQSGRPPVARVEGRQE